LVLNRGRYFLILKKTDKNKRFIDRENRYGFNFFDMREYGKRIKIRRKWMEWLIEETLFLIFDTDE
jgi:hypothetical protein